MCLCHPSTRCSFTICPSMSNLIWKMIEAASIRRKDDGRDVFNVEVSFQFIRLLDKWIFKKYIASMERRAWKSCLENEAVNSLFKWKQTAEQRKKSQVSIEDQFIARYIYTEKKCARAQKSVFLRVISSRIFCSLFCYFDGVRGSEKLVGKEGEKLGIFSPWDVHIPQNLKEDHTFFFILYQGIYLRKSEANISKYVPH